MPRVELLSNYAGPSGTGYPGDIVDVPSAEAADLVEGGFARRLERGETATSRPSETATSRPAETEVKQPSETASLGNESGRSGVTDPGEHSAATAVGAAPPVQTKAAKESEDEPKTVAPRTRRGPSKPVSGK